MERKNEVEVMEIVENGNVFDFINGLYDELELLNEKLDSKSGGRKLEVLNILKRGECISIKDIGKELSISGKNVSSLLSYLRSDGYNICTDRNGKKFLMD